MDFELSFLKQAIKDNEQYQKKLKKQNYIDEKLIDIVESFIKKNELICYGGIAINNILPDDAQFYDYHIDIPDYDFFSPNALKNAKELADIFISNGYKNVEAKSAFFHGTYKVFVNFIPIADITQVNEKMYKQVLINSIKRHGIRYCNPTFLRMSLHQELSRPMGDTSRWEKIFNRLNILNAHYPFEVKNKNIQNEIDVNSKNKIIYDILKLFVRKQEYILCGEYAMFLYSRKSKYQRIKALLKGKDIYKFSIYVDNIEEFKNSINDLFSDYEYNIELKYHDINFKYMKNFYTLHIDDVLFMNIYLTNSCVSYNKVSYRKISYNVASIDTLLSLYFGLIVTEHETINVQNLYIHCFILYSILKNTYDVTDPLLKRFTLPCIGEHENFEDIKKNRTKKFNKLKHNKKSKEYQEWFLQYIPKNDKLQESKTKTRKLYTM